MSKFEKWVRENLNDLMMREDVRSKEIVAVYTLYVDLHHVSGVGWLESNSGDDFAILAYCFLRHDFVAGIEWALVHK